MLDGVEEIGGEAFSECESLASVTIPESVTNIGTWAFAAISRFSIIDDPLVFTVEAGSYAEEYCKNNGFTYRYPGAGE